MALETTAADPTSFEREFGQALQSLRGALIELAGFRPDLPEKPYPLAQALGINKNLAWRLVQVMRSQELLDTVRHLPGETGMGRVLEAYASHGAAPELVEAVERAVARYDEVARRHAGSRRGLEAMLAGLAGAQHKLRLEALEGLRQHRGRFAKDAGQFHRPDLQPVGLEQPRGRTGRGPRRIGCVAAERLEPGEENHCPTLAIRRDLYRKPAEMFLWLQSRQGWSPASAPLAPYAGQTHLSGDRRGQVREMHQRCRPASGSVARPPALM